MKAHAAFSLMLMAGTVSASASVARAPSVLFLPQAAGVSSEVFDSIGCLLQKGNSAVPVDQSGTQVFEIWAARKTKLRHDLIGSKVRVLGAVDLSATPSPESGAQRVVVMGGIKRTEKGGCADLAMKIGASAVAERDIETPVAAAAAKAGSNDH